MTALLALLLVLGLAPLAEAATYYVGKSGSNANSCATATSSTAASRKLTIAGASGGISCLAAGDTLVIGPGVYNEAIQPDTVPSGTGAGGEAAEATWAGATVIRAETPCAGTSCTTILRPTSGNCAFNGSVAVVWLNNTTVRRYIILRGFEADANSTCVSGISFSTANAAAPDHLRLQNVYVHDATASLGGSGMIAVGSTVSGTADHIEVLDSVVKNFSMAGSFPTMGGNHCLYWNAHGTIRRNVIVNCSPTDHNGMGIATHSGPGDYAVDISANDVSGFGYQGIEAADTLNTKIYDNVIHDGGGTAAQCASTCAGIAINGNYSPVTTLVANNTIYNVSGGGAPAILRYGPTTTGTSIQNNILFGGTNDTITAGTDGGTIGNNRCSSGCATTATPIFINAGAGNFRLSASSPAAITTGGVNLSGSFTTDADGTLWGATWGMGAYKTSSSGPTAPTNLRFTP